MPPKPLDRRTLLRGLLAGGAVSVALPALECMLNSNGVALASGVGLPDRFGLWFWGNGVRPERWVPPTTGPNWTPSDELAPLADLVPHVSVVSGCEVKTATHPHHSGMTGILTGQRYHQLGTTRDTIVSTFARRSVDQDAAEHLSGAVPFRSLEVGVTRFHGTDEGSTFQHLSHNGPNSFNASEYDPYALYRRLFLGELDPQLNLARRSALDAVTEQAAHLRARVGARDRERIDQHLDSVRALELRIATGVSTCGPSTAPTAIPDIDGREQIAEKNAVMSDLVTLALACDLTRVFSIQFSTCGSGVLWWQAGATNGLHYTCHTEPTPQPTVHAATVLTMDQLAHFLRRLRDTPEGAGSLLDRCAILCTTELSDGLTHSNQEFPILIAGHGNGRLVGGVHYRSQTRENTSHAVLTALRGAGVPLSSWGVGQGYVSSTLADLES